jgi:hypothetical protein
VTDERLDQDMDLSLGEELDPRPDHGPRPERLRALVAAWAVAGSLLVVTGFLVAIGWL